MPTQTDELGEELSRISGVHRDADAHEDIPLEFHGFTAAGGTPDLIAVDGSYAFLLNLDAWYLAALSTAALRYTCGTGYSIATHRLHQRVVAVSTREDFVKTQSDRHQAIFAFTRNRQQHANEMVNEFRRCEEALLAMRMAADHKDLLLAVDGTLTTFPKEYAFGGDVVREAEQNGHILFGVSKDSDLHAFGSTRRDEELLRRHGREVEGCAFVRAPGVAADRQKTFLLGDVYYVRLHPDAPKWFRVDLGTSKDDPERAFGLLAAYCRARHSLGYPMPLMEAHRMAVTVRHLKPMYEQAVLRRATELGLNLRDVIDGLTHVEGKRRSAYHEYLDRLTGDRR